MNLQASTRGIASFHTTFRGAWGYFQREMIYLTWSLMEATLLVPFALGFMPWARSWSPDRVLLWFWLVMLLSFNLVRLMGVLYLPRERQRWVLVIALVLVALGSSAVLFYHPVSIFDFSWLARFYENIDEANSTWTRDLSVFLTTVLLWWRGIRLSSQEFTINRAGLRLRLGGLILAPIVVWGGRRLSWDITPYILLFFLAGLVGVALVRAEQVERSHSGQSATLNPRWLSTVVIASLGLVLTTAALGALISGNATLLLIGWLAPLWSALSFGGTTIGRIVIHLTRPLFFLLDLLIHWLSILVARIVSLAVFEELSLPTFDFPTPEATSEAVEQVGTSFDSGRLIMLLLMLAIVLLVSLSLGRLYRQSQVSPLGDDLMATGNEQPSRGKDNLGKRLLQRLGLWRRQRAARSIRRIYQAMCRAAEASGFPRAASETPYEYLPTLAEAWPSNTADHELITRAYVRVRYGELPETKGEMEEILRAWRRLEETPPAGLTITGPQPTTRRR